MRPFILSTTHSAMSFLTSQQGSRGRYCVMLAPEHTPLLAVFEDDVIRTLAIVRAGNVSGRVLDNTGLLLGCFAGRDDAYGFTRLGFQRVTGEALAPHRLCPDRFAVCRALHFVDHHLGAIDGNR